MLNKIFLMGRLTRDPEMRHTQNGTAVASFSIAVDRDFKDKQSGEKVTDFVDIVAWRSTAEFVDKYFSKGRMAVVEGRLQIRDWTDTFVLSSCPGQQIYCGQLALNLLPLCCALDRGKLVCMKNFHGFTDRSEGVAQITVLLDA